MTKEEVQEEPAFDVLHFDAHEFDGLRETLDQEAKSIIHKGDQFIRDHPWVCAGMAALAGIAIGRVLCGRRQ